MLKQGADSLKINIIDKSLAIQTKKKKRENMPYQYQE